ncbi:MAG: hypothetical protein OEZ19_09095 [Paracoccaceae bacterium]|nr:hypothetical protein [Paracoccaceae bacterium]
MNTDLSQAYLETLVLNHEDEIEVMAVAALGLERSGEKGSVEPMGDYLRMGIT